RRAAPRRRHPGPTAGSRPLPSSGRPRPPGPVVPRRRSPYAGPDEALASGHAGPPIREEPIRLARSASVGLFHIPYAGGSQRGGDGASDVEEHPPVLEERGHRTARPLDHGARHILSHLVVVDADRWKSEERRAGKE